MALSEEGRKKCSKRKEWLVLLEEGRKKSMQKEGKVGTFIRGEEESDAKGRKCWHF